MWIHTESDKLCQFILLIPAKGLNSYFQPFYQPEEQGKALCVRPDIMEYDEVQEFPEFTREQQMYLALRNLILALWCTNCKVRFNCEYLKNSRTCMNKTW